MIIRVETTIPSGRQYENIKTSYELETTTVDKVECDRKRYWITEMAKEDCERLNGCMVNQKKVIVNSEVEEISVVNGVTFIKKEGKWTFIEKEKK